MPEEIQLVEDHVHLHESSWLPLHFLENDLGLISNQGIGNTFNVSISNLTLDGAIIADFVGTASWSDGYYTNKTDSYQFGEYDMEIGLHQWRSADDDEDSFRDAFISIEIEGQSYKDWSYSIDFDYTVTAGGEQYQSHASYFIGEHGRGLETAKEMTSGDLSDEIIVTEYSGWFSNDHYAVASFDEIFGAYAEDHPDIPIRFNASTIGTSYDDETRQLLLDIGYLETLDPGSTVVLGYNFVMGDDRDLTFFDYDISFTVSYPEVVVDEMGVAEGTEGDEVMVGSEGDDVMNGGGGNDRFEADAGNDLLVGGSGDDTYMLAPGSGVDRIIDDGGTIDLFADIPEDKISMILYEINGVPELHISLLDDDGNETGDKLIIENFGVDQPGGSGGGGGGGNGILGWNIPPNGPGGTEPAITIKPAIQVGGNGPREYTVPKVEGAKTNVQILDFDADDLRLMRAVDSPDDLIIYFRNEPNVSLRVEDHFNADGTIVPAVTGIVFYEAEELDLTKHLVLEGTDQDEVILGSSHEDTLIGGGGHDVFTGNRGELEGDKISDVSSGDSIHVVGAQFSYENVFISSDGIVEIDYDPDLSGAELKFRIENWSDAPLDYDVAATEQGTTIDFISAPTIKADDICVIGGARIDLTRLFDVQDLDNDITAVEVSFTYVSLDGAGQDITRWDRTVEGGAGAPITEQTLTLSYEEFQSFEFKNVGIWKEPGKLDGWANVAYPEQDFDGFIKASIKVHDARGHSTDWVDAYVGTDEYKQTDNVGDSLSKLGLVISGTVTAFEEYVTYVPKSSSISPQLRLALDITGDAISKIGILGGAAIHLFSADSLGDDRPYMTDREFASKYTALMADGAMMAASVAFGIFAPITGGASLIAAIAIETLSQVLGGYAVFERLANAAYERIYDEDGSFDRAKAEELIQAILETQGLGEELAVDPSERVSVMEAEGGYVANNTAISAEDLKNATAEQMAQLENVERLAIVNDGTLALEKTEEGVAITYEDEAGRKSVHFVSEGGPNVSLHDSEADLLFAEMEHHSKRSFYENWVRAEESTVDLTGRANDDLLIGSQGNDTFAVGGGDDEVYGAEGADAMSIAAGMTADEDSFRFIDFNADEGDTITLTGFDRERTISSLEDLQELVDAGYASIEAWDDETGDVDVTLSGLDDDLISLANTLAGGAGYDTLVGGGGDDMIYGAGGNDVIAGDEGHDFIDGGSGNDSIHGGDGDDNILGSWGGDAINGGRGNDTIDGGSSSDQLGGSLGDDLIYGGAGNDAISGGDGDDYLDGGVGNDTIVGDAGNDIIEGGRGTDHLFGMAGQDTFVFKDGSGMDALRDFEVLQDKIDLSAQDTSYAGIHIYEAYGSTRVTNFDDEGSTIYLMGITQADINESHFVF